MSEFINFSAKQPIRNKNIDGVKGEDCRAWFYICVALNRGSALVRIYIYSEENSANSAIILVEKTLTSRVDY